MVLSKCMIVADAIFENLNPFPFFLFQYVIEEEALYEDLKQLYARFYSWLCFLSQGISQATHSWVLRTDEFRQWSRGTFLTEVTKSPPEIVFSKFLSIDWAKIAIPPLPPLEKCLNSILLSCCTKTGNKLFLKNSTNSIIFLMAMQTWSQDTEGHKDFLSRFSIE